LLTGVIDNINRLSPAEIRYRIKSMQPEWRVGEFMDVTAQQRRNQLLCK